MKSTNRILFPLFSGVIFVGIWYLVIWIWDISPYFLPPIHEVIRAGTGDWKVILSATWMTGYYGLIGFSIAVSLGLLIALGLSISNWIKYAVYPWVLMIQMTPIIIFAPIIVLWFDYGVAAIVTIVFTVSFFPIVANTLLGLNSTDPDSLDCFAIYGASGFQKLIYIRIPGALASSLNGIKIAATLMPIGAVFGEFFMGSFAGGKGGLGLLVFIYNKETRIPELFATGFAACALGVLVVGSVKLVEWILLHRWHESYAVQNQSR